MNRNSVCGNIFLPRNCAGEILQSNDNILIPIGLNTFGSGRLGSDHLRRVQKIYILRLTRGH